jgi:hypothetical protein
LDDRSKPNCGKNGSPRRRTTVSFQIGWIHCLFFPASIFVFHAHIPLQVLTPRILECKAYLTMEKLLASIGQLLLNVAEGDFLRFS